MPVQAIIRYVVVHLRARVIWQASWSAPAHLPSSIVREHTRQKRGNETALNSKPLCMYMCCCCCSRWVETGISSMRDHARARASPKMKSCRPVCCIVGGVFHSKGDTTHRTAAIDVLLLPSLHRPINVFFSSSSFFFNPLFIIWKKKKKVPNFFFLSYSTDHYRYRILWFFSSVFGGCWWMTTILHLATNETAISVGSLSFFVVVGLTPSDRFVITFLSPEKFLFLFHNYPVVFDNLRPIIVKLLFFFMAGERKRVSNANHRTFPLIFCSHLFWLNRKF